MSEQDSARNSGREITERLMREFPREALKHREGGGRNGLAYYSGTTIIRRLIDATDNQFDVAVTDVTFGETLITARVRLTIPDLGSREHMGVQRWSDKTRSGALAGEDLVKGAITDGLKKAATLFGVALDLYGDDFESEPEPRESRPAATAKPVAPASKVAMSASEAVAYGRRAQVEAMIEDYPAWNIERAKTALKELGAANFAAITDEMLDQLQSQMDAAEESSPDDPIERINRTSSTPDLAKLANDLIKAYPDSSHPVRVRLKERFDELKAA